MAARDFASHTTTMILYMRAKRSGARRAALAGAALVAVLGAMWWLDGTSPRDAPKEAAAPVPAPAVRQVQAPPADVDERPVVRDLATAGTSPIALGSAPPRPAVAALPVERDDAATLVPRPAQMPSTSKRDDDEPEN